MSEPPIPPFKRPDPGGPPDEVAEHRWPGDRPPESEAAQDRQTDLFDGGAADRAEEGSSPAGSEPADHLVPAGWAPSPGDAAEEAGEAGEALFPLGPERLRSVIESLLFASDKPLTTARIAELLEGAAAAPREPTGPPLYQPAQIADALHAVAAELRAGRRGIELHEVAGGWQLRTAPENATWVQRLLQQKPVRLARGQIETLAIVAYRQPITRPEIDDIRGVDSGGSLKLLLERGLIRILGKKEEPGRPLLYGTTKEFLEFFNLRDLKDLPTLREYNDLSDEHKAKMRALGHEPPEGAASVMGGPPAESTAPPTPGDAELAATGEGTAPPAEGEQPAAAAAEPTKEPSKELAKELIDQQLADDAEQLAKIDEMIRTVSTAFPLLDPNVLAAMGVAPPDGIAAPIPTAPPPAAAPENEPKGPGRGRPRKPRAQAAEDAASPAKEPEGPESPEGPEGPEGLKTSEIPVSPFGPSGDLDDELSGEAEIEEPDREPEEL